MDLTFREECRGIDWELVRDIMNTVGVPRREALDIKRAFENSYAVVFAFYEDRLIGFGRVLSDGIYQAAMYDIAVVPEFQGKGFGKTITEMLLHRVVGCNVILYATPGRESFYTKLGFRLMKTGMAKFLNPQKMESRGFI